MNNKNLKEIFVIQLKKKRKKKYKERVARNDFKERMVSKEKKETD